jgi:hypothetical protein
MFQEKKRMSLKEYLSGTNKPEDCFLEDKDYIIFRSQPNGLRIVIDKNAYYASKSATAEQPHSHLLPPEELRFFDMMTVKYRLPRIPANSDIRIMFGQYYVTPEGPCFYLTEPRTATHAMILNFPKFPDYYRMGTLANPKYDSQEYSDDDCQVIVLDSIFEWVSKIIYISTPLDWEKDNYLKKCQLSFFKQLDDFYCA